LRGERAERAEDGG
jgi:hypothetical protein